MNAWYPLPEELPFKLRLYIQEGSAKGTMLGEEFFPDLDALQGRYNEGKNQSIRPTAFEFQGGSLGWVPLSLE